MKFSGQPADMPRRLWQSCRFNHSQLGLVEVTVRSNSRRMVARRVGRTIRLSAPVGVGFDQLLDFLKYLDEKLPCPTQLPHYADGDTIECQGVSFVMRRQSHRPQSILTTPRLPVTAVEVGSVLDMESAEVTRSITSIICKAARALAPQVLLPDARTIADSLGVHPAGWTISSGHRILGHCDNKGIIALSCVLVFLPAHLRRYIVCHELAHLSEMNHSPRFHRLCDTYCGGCEKLWQAELRNYKWPIHRP